MPALQTSLAQALGDAITGICAMIAHFASRGHRDAALLALVHARLVRLVLRFDRLAQRWQANTLPPPRPSRAGQPRPAPAAPARRMPAGRGWLVALVQPTVRFSGLIQGVLDCPDTRALVEAAPQAGRLLRPLCRALAIDPPAWLRLPGTPEPPPPRPSPARRTWPPSLVAPAPIGPFPTPPYRQIFG
ncbi:MAG: hypothetical protein IT555_04695 [Acetobacteraceae bacterium]|nr:hypothetical protein [Acetobacteraceae bacterium]